MPIPAVILDDLTWSDLTAATRGRIVAASNGKWTLHAAVDPGITLLELHAWLLEQRLYWMDQVPDALSRGALALLGDAADDAQCAATVLSFNLTPSQFGRVAAGTLMTLQDSDPPLVFSVQSATTILPMASASGRSMVQRPLLSLAVGGVDHTGALAIGRSICLFSDAGAVGEMQITLWLTQPLAAPAASDEITLAFLLDPAGNAVPAEWSADAAIGVAPPAKLSWWYATAGGQRARFADEQVSDGTDGMRRSGITRLALPADWAGTASATGGAYGYTVWVRAETLGFSAPPRLAGLWPNVAIARHRRILRRLHDVDWLPLPDNTLVLDADEQPPLVAGTKLRLRERDGQWHWWLPTADLAFHGREDRVFVVDRDAAMLTFGNGETGRIPVLGWRFTVRDIVDPRALALAWHGGADPVSIYVRTLLSPQSAATIAAYSGAAPPDCAVLRALLDGLNAAIATQALYEPTRFAAVALSAATQNLLALQPVPGSTDHERLNRSLLEDAYPAKLRRGAADLTIAVGGGVAGNVGTLRPWEPFSDQPGPAPLALNIVMGEGGAESETLDAARLRAATELRRPARAVIADDFVALARTTPGVAIARAHAAVGYHPDFPCLAVPGAVTVFIVPDAPREDTASPPCPRVIAPLPDAGALAAVAARLEVARLIGNEIYVRAPIYRRIAVTVAVQSSFSAPDALRGDITARLQDFLDPLIGGDDKNGWPFGEPIRPSVILREAEAALNQRGDVVSVSMRLLDVAASTDESCKDTVIGAHALVRLETVTIRISALPAGATGGLQ